MNHNPTTFIGSLSIAFNFSTKDSIIAPQSVEVFDNERSMFLSKISGQFNFYGSGGLMISQDQLGVVLPNSARTFDVYWLYTETPTMSVTPSVLHLVLVPSGVPFIGTLDIFYLFVLTLGILAVVFGVLSYDRTTHKPNIKIFFVSIICIVMIVILSGAY